MYSDKIEICENDKKRVIAIEKIEQVIVTDDRLFRGYIEFVIKGFNLSMNFYQTINNGKAMPIFSKEQIEIVKEIKVFIEEKFAKKQFTKKGERFYTVY